MTAIKSEIPNKLIIIEQLKSWLEDAEQMDEEDAEAEQNQLLLHLEEARKALEVLEKFLMDSQREEEAGELCS